MPDDALERGRDVAVGLGEVRGILLENSAHGIDGRVAVEGALAGKHFIKDCAEGKNIGARISRFAANLLGRHVAHGAHHGSGIGCNLLRGSVAGIIGFGPG